MQIRGRVLIAMFAVALLLAGCRPYQFQGTPYEPPQTAAQISGVNWNGENFSLSQLQGKPVLLFFGYTNCPDVCPTTLAEMRMLRQNLGAKADKMAFVYVSVDPDRDTVERLKQFIPLFDPAFYGVHIDSTGLEPVKQSYGVYAEKVYQDPSDPSKGYSVDHTARTYLINPSGQLVASYPYGTDIESIQKDVEHFIK
ncbi:MAG: SCO family protein [Nitrososphaerales archaeon]